jgi:imidazolonepropionase-like amidohydrolase
MKVPVAVVAIVCCAVLRAATTGHPVSHAQQPVHARPIGITHGTVIDVQGGRRLRDHTVIIEGGRISTVGPSAQVRVPDGYGVIDARGKFIIPGLIDTHVHLMWDRDSALTPDSTIRWLELFVPFGVTTIREASARDLDRPNMAWRTVRDTGGLPVPRIYVSGRVDRRHVAVSGAADASDLTRRLIARGVDGIKIRDDLTLDEIRGIVGAARAERKPVFGHTYLRDSDYTREAVLAGIDGVMHVNGLRPLGRNSRPDPPPADTTDWEAAWLYRNGEWLSEDTALTDSLIRLMVRRRVWLEPTLVNEEFILLGPDELRRHPGARFMRHPVEWWREGYPLPRGAALEQARASVDGMKRFVRRFHDAGGMVIAGTDGHPFYGAGIHDELRLLVEAGLTPAAALRAATYDAARALRWEKEIGSVSPGRHADLLILDASPLDDIRNTTRINAIVLGGRFIQASERERLLARLAAR